MLKASNATRVRLFEAETSSPTGSRHVKSSTTRPRVLRIFPDYADSVLWLAEPVPYGISGLTRELVHDLAAWEQFYYDSLTADVVFRSPELAHEFTVRGRRLAGRVADELGEGWEVEFRSYEPRVAPVRIRGRGVATNAQAAAAFDALVADRDAEQAESQRARVTGDGRWSARAPLSDTRYGPGDRDV